MATIGLGTWERYYFDILPVGGAQARQRWFITVWGLIVVVSTHARLRVTLSSSRHVDLVQLHQTFGIMLSGCSASAQELVCHCGGIRQAS